jgi:hypothetical protein
MTFSLKQNKIEVAPRPGFEPGSSGRQPLILFRQHEKIQAETGLYYLGYPWVKDARWIMRILII